jgi:phosphate transport system ATP-binding protein
VLRTPGGALSGGQQQAKRVSSQCAFFLAAENTPGHIVEAGLTWQVFEDPADSRTADYVHGRFG